MIVAYDGTAYHGWQVQKNNPSIQATLQEVLAILHKHEVEIVGSGRTDAHVHALGQVFHFDTTLQIPLESWPKAMNALLPRDIRIQSAHYVSDDFHARYSVMGKRYDYLVTNEVENPFVQHYMAKQRSPMDVQRMQECADVFVGTHDFNAFTSAQLEPHKNRVKTIFSIRVIQEANAVRLSFYGKGFLRYQVRMLSQTIIMCGIGKISVSQAKAMLESTHKEACPYNGEPCGLYLMKVVYEEAEHENELSYPHHPL